MGESGPVRNTLSWLKSFSCRSKVTVDMRPIEKYCDSRTALVVLCPANKI